MKFNPLRTRTTELPEQWDSIMPKASYVVYTIFGFGHPAKSDSQPNQEVVDRMTGSPKKLFLTLVSYSSIVQSNRQRTGSPI